MPSSDAIRNNAISRLEEASAEVRRWTEFLRSYDELSGRQHSAPPATHAVVRDFVVPVEFGSPPRSKAEHTKMLARRVLSGGGFTPTRVLLQELLKLGDEIGGKEPQATLSSRLIGADDLENIRPHGWRLKPRQTNGTAGPLVEQTGPAVSGSTPDMPSGEPMPATSRTVEPAPGGGT